MPGEYQGYVRYSGGEIYSTQCAAGGDCADCPDDTPEGQERDGGGPLEGYYCECGCHS